MLQQINKKKIHFYIFSFIFLTTIINQNLFFSLNNSFLLKEINIVTDSEEIKDKIKLNTNYLLNKNIFNVNKNKLIKKLNDLNFLENVNIKKKYPFTIIINADKTEFLATTYIKNKKHFVARNGNFILASQIENNQKLPIIFGKFKVTDYLKLKSILSEKSINQDQIAKYYFHKNNRWDLYYKNKIVIKLPSKNIINAINLYEKYKKRLDIKPNTIIDLRIHNRIIVNNGQKIL